MSENDECVHGLSVAACALGYHGPRMLHQNAGQTFRASTEGLCPACDETIEPGVKVTKMEPSGLYVHASSCVDGFWAEG